MSHCHHHGCYGSGCATLLAVAFTIGLVVEHPWLLAVIAGLAAAAAVYKAWPPGGRAPTGGDHDEHRSP